MSQILRKEDRGKIANGNAQKKIESLSDLVMVHLTDYIPKDGIISSSKDAGVMGESVLQIGGQEFTIPVPSERDTVHFCMNGEVSSHKLGDWSEMKYAIIVPFDKVDPQNIIGGMTVDTYTRGSFHIPQGSYILCPQTEMENINDLTQNLTVVGYEGKSVNGYADMFLSLAMGYKKEEIGEWSWKDQNDNKTAADIYKRLGLKQIAHSLSDENNIARARSSIYKFCSALKLIRENELITDNNTYQEAYTYLHRTMGCDFSTPITSILTILSDDMLTQQFYEGIEATLGISLPEKMKEKFNESRKIAYELDNQEGPEVTWRRTEAFAVIESELIRLGLEPHREKYLKPIMDEYISKYQDLMQERSQLPPEERENALQKLANSLNEEIFSSDKISQIFFAKLQEQGLLTEDDKTAILIILQQGDMSSIKSEDMKKFIESHRENVTNIGLVSRILTKKIEDEVIYGKKIAELSEDEKQILKYKIQDFSITSEKGYTIRIPCEKVQNYEFVDAVGEVSPIIQIETDEAETLLSDRLSGVAHFQINAIGNYETDFTTIQDSETIGQYLSRMKQCVSLISRCIDGEKVQFNEYGELSNGDIQNLLQSYSNMGISSSDVETAYGILTKTKNEREHKETTQNQCQEL